MAAQERTCVVCRSKAPKGTLVRLVLRGKALVLDERQSLPGRGGYVHPSVECVSKMAQPAKWDRALRAGPGGLDVAELRRVAQGLLQQLAGSSSGASVSGASKPRGRFGLGRAG